MELLEHEADVFRSKAGPAILAQRVEVSSIDMDRAAGGFEQASGGHEECRLAAAARAAQGDEFSACDLQGDIDNGVNIFRRRE